MGVCCSSGKKVPDKSDKYKDKSDGSPVKDVSNKGNTSQQVLKFPDEHQSAGNNSKLVVIDSIPLVGNKGEKESDKSKKGESVEKSKESPKNSQKQQAPSNPFAFEIPKRDEMTNPDEFNFKKKNPLEIADPNKIEVDFKEADFDKGGFGDGPMDSNFLDDQPYNQISQNSNGMRLPTSSKDIHQDSLLEEGRELLEELQEAANLNPFYAGGFEKKKSAPPFVPDQNLVYRYQAECLKNLPQSQHQFLKYIELMSLPTQGTEINEENLLDNGYQADSRVKNKNNLIMIANDRVGNVELPLWDVFKFTSNDYITRQSANYVDPSFQFEKNLLTTEGLRATSIRKLPAYVIFDEETMAEGMVFSDRNLTSISAAVACLIHFDNKLKTKLVKNLIFPQNVRMVDLEHRTDAKQVRHVHGQASHQRSDEDDPD